MNLQLNLNHYTLVQVGLSSGPCQGEIHLAILVMSDLAPCIFQICVYSVSHEHKGISISNYRRSQLLSEDFAILECVLEYPKVFGVNGADAVKSNAAGFPLHLEIRWGDISGVRPLPFSTFTLKCA